MAETIKWITNKAVRENGKKASVEDFSLESAKGVKRFHESFDIYSKTSLVRLKGLSKKLGVSEILVKDESYRFGLNAFKVLGGSYAIGNFLSKKLNVPMEEITFDMLRSKEIKEKLADITFVTATDGNHGRGVAWAAQQLGQKAVVYMPKGSSETRLNNIKATGAEASITDMNYDDAVRFSLDKANENKWEMIQDTAWEGYYEVPKWIMQGYVTLMLEAKEQMEEINIEKPTHVFIQAGVGAFAGAVQGFIADAYGEDRPITVVVEPNKADCMYRSAKNKKITNVTGDMDTIMAGLACGEPNPIGWEILNDYADAYISCPEYVSADGMRILGNPLQGDEKVVSGESGAVTTGMVYSILKDEELKELKEELKLDENSKILVVSTEGDTDPDYYRKIVWEGIYGHKVID
ncbi:diaminopropionate ammonia-lyase [Clostridium sp. D2Q-14]|uniref:diaminopropionate ammonia-lyase n=1 Tax=Anaeromonas gelatinilytica TaxID=2683194 RepID=UPI00193BFE8E|nr:diaminopropionate ammonia-lyase [Anaeromonas gelatinilytica]MBS4535232.1 diaminopropionate ammonia-lyase [Anaeromonas gelatinilytica]